MPDITIGQTATFSKTITDADIRAFAQATGDHNPVHLDEAYAAATRFSGRIAHGLLTVGLISACIARTWPGAIYLGQQVRFLKPVRPGDTVTATLEVTAYDTEKQRATLRTDAHNQRGEQVVGGEASVWVAGG